MLVRFYPSVNDRLRLYMTYQGDLSIIVQEAVRMAPDLHEIKLLQHASVGEQAHSTTVTMPVSLRAKLRKISASRGASMNALLNAAVAHWLGQKYGRS